MRKEQLNVFWIEQRSELVLYSCHRCHSFIHYHHGMENTLRGWGLE